MDEDLILDAEFKRYLKIIKPYLEQLLDKNIIEICNAWIHKLISCDGVEKTQRNKYIFTLCYQLATGSLSEPFTKLPAADELAPLSDGSVNDDSLGAECLIGNTGTEVFVNQKECDTLTNELLNGPDNISQVSFNNSCEYISTSKDDNRCIDFTLSEMNSNTRVTNKTKHIMTFGNRAKNLILKLRNMKKENTMLHNQIMCLKEETKIPYDYSFSDNVVTSNISNACHNIKHTDSRINLIETITSLHEKLEHFNEIKKYEIDSLTSRHNLEILEAKTATKIEVMESYENKILELTHKYERFVENLRRDHDDTLERLRIENDSKMSKKDEIIKSKDIEISHLRKNVEDLQSQCNKSASQSSQKLEDRLNKIEKTKIKYATRISNFQREKHMNECSFQLQLIKQKAQIINDNTDENQTDLVKALEKLEGKYKEIVATVQATAVQRRIQDQFVLENLIKTICDIPSKSNLKDFSEPNNVTNLINAMPANNINISSPPHKIGIIDKSLKREKNKDDNTICHDNGRLGEDIEILHIPQRDMVDITKK